MNNLPIFNFLKKKKKTTSFRFSTDTEPNNVKCELTEIEWVLILA